MNEDNGKFYRDKTWELVMNEISDVKRTQRDMKVEQAEQRQILETLNGRMKYIYGFAAAIGVATSFVWQWFVAQFKSK